VLSAARKALALDPNNAEAYTCIATTEYRTLLDFEAAERDYRRSLQLNPNYATGHQWYSEYLRELGRIGEARREIATALRLDPLSKAITTTACWGLKNEARLDEAVAFARDAAAHGRPQFLCAARALFDSGDEQELLRELDRNRADPIFARLAEAYRRGGRRGFLETRLGMIRAMPNGDVRYGVEIAESYTLLGRNDEAFATLEKAFECRGSHVTSFHLFAGFDSVRNDPRFAALAHRIGLPDEALQAAREFAAKRAAAQARHKRSR
jgi:tetratricopeptide (TPR) repeat protein